MKRGFSEQIRQLAKEKYVDPAVRSGKAEFSIPVRGMMDVLLPAGFPKNHTPQICTSIQTAKFLRLNDIEIVSIDGPPSGQSPTVVVHYRVAGRVHDGRVKQRKTAGQNSAEESAEVRARRLTDTLKGLLKKELSGYGGAEAFVHWIRSDEEAS